jgi:hypothetical protein
MIQHTCQNCTAETLTAEKLNGSDGASNFSKPNVRDSLRPWRLGGESDGNLEVSKSSKNLKGVPCFRSRGAESAE